MLKIKSWRLLLVAAITLSSVCALLAAYTLIIIINSDLADYANHRLTAGQILFDSSYLLLCAGFVLLTVYLFKKYRSLLER